MGATGPGSPHSEPSKTMCVARKTRGVQFASQNLVGFVAALLTAFAAPGCERATESGWSHVRVGLAQRNLVSEYHLWVPMRPLVLAEHYPAIGRLLPRAILWLRREAPETPRLTYGCINPNGLG